MNATVTKTAMADRPGRIATGTRMRSDSDDSPVQPPVSVFPPGWQDLLAVEVAVFVAIAVIYGAVPGAVSGFLFGGSIFVSALTDRIARLAGSDIANIPRRFAVLVVGIVVPMALFGASLAQWSMVEGKFAWQGAVAAISLVLLAASIIAGKRTATLLAVQVGMWAGFAFIVSSWAGMFTQIGRAHV